MHTVAAVWRDLLQGHREAVHGRQSPVITTPRDTVLRAVDGPLIITRGAAASPAVGGGKEAVTTPAFVTTRDASPARTSHGHEHRAQRD